MKERFLCAVVKRAGSNRRQRQVRKVFVPIASRTCATTSQLVFKPVPNREDTDLKPRIGAQMVTSGVWMKQAEIGKEIEP